MFSSSTARQKWEALNEAIDNAPIVVPCQNTDPDLWFPDETEDAKGLAATRYTQARKLCAVCPVKELCLEYALAQPEYDGMWGGLSPVERKRLRQAPRGRPRK